MQMTVLEFADFIESIDNSPTSECAFDMNKERRYAYILKDQKYESPHSL